MKWLLILFLTDVNGDYAITQVMYSRADCMFAGESILAEASRYPRRTAAIGSYQCWPTDPDQIAYIADGVPS